MNKKKFLPLLPGLIWFCAFCIGPILLLIVTSFLSRGQYGQIEFKITFENYSRFFNWLYVQIFLRSFSLALITVLGTLFLGYPIAYIIHRAKKIKKIFLLASIILPFWTNSVVKAIAIKTLTFHFLDFLPRFLSVWLGMITNYLPFMVLPLIAQLNTIDDSLIDAAYDLSASPAATLWHVIIPLTKVGIVTGCIFVFIPALGEFLVPDLIGGSQTVLIGNLITDQFIKIRDWPFGAALSIFLIAFIPISSFCFRKTLKT